MKKICVVTATRAEYGLLRRIIEQIRADSELELCLAVTGTHLSHEFGYTVSEIEKDGFPITARIPIMKEGKEEEKVTDIMAAAMSRFGDFFRQEKPDMAILLGDRYELIPIGMSAAVCNVPIAHLNGGEITEGAVDDVVRHCITKMSYLHFTACEEYRNRVIQLGEEPGRVFCYGDTGVENVEKMTPVGREDLARLLEISVSRPWASVTFHPVTREQGSAGEQVKELLNALSEFTQMDFIITMANADEGGKEINGMLKEYAGRYSHLKLFASLGVRNYLSLLHYVKMVIGNSSSGIIEAPSVGIPTVDIGDRQKGRLCAESVIHCGTTAEEIKDAIRQAAGDEMQELAGRKANPYSGGDTSRRVVETVKEYLQNGRIDAKKKFYDLPVTNVHGR